MSQVTEQSVRFQTALASIKLIQASAVLDLTEDDFDFLTSNKVWIATDLSRARRCVEACVYGTLDFVGFFFFYCSGDHRDLHSFPTRRSSDLPDAPEKGPNDRLRFPVRLVFGHSLRDRG